MRSASVATRESNVDAMLIDERELKAGDLVEMFSLYLDFRGYSVVEDQAPIIDYTHGGWAQMLTVSHIGTERRYVVLYNGKIYTLYGSSNFLNRKLNIIERR